MIIDDLLIIGEIEASSPSQEEINLKPFVQSCLNSQSPLLQNKNIRVELRAPDDQVSVRIDPEKFRRVLENIISNAIKFSKFEGLVIITLKKEGKNAQILIRDNGIGIHTKLQASIFNKFTLAGRPGTHGEPATGLGLYIAKQIIEKHGGKIWVESQEEVGTTFFIKLNSN